MPAGSSENWQIRTQLIRRVEVVRGVMAFRMECSPAFNYARDEHETEVTEAGACFRSAHLSLGLATQIPLKQRDNGVFAEFALREEQSAVFVLREIDSGAAGGVAFARSEVELFM